MSVRLAVQIKTYQGHRDSLNFKCNKAISGIGKTKWPTEPTAHGIGKLWAICKKFGPSGLIKVFS